jgi:predicted  nucleic acid-binding Zn-ribbon protein
MVDHLCTEQKRMERIEKKLDDLHILLSDFRVEMAKVLVEMAHAKKADVDREAELTTLRIQVYELQTKIAIIDSLASKRDVLYANIIAIGAVVATVVGAVLTFLQR